LLSPLGQSIQSAAHPAVKELGRPMIQASFRIVAPEGKREEILDVLLCLKGPTEVATGCRACWILQDAEDDHVLIYLVKWDTEREIEEHLRSERFRRLLPYIEMSVEPPKIDFSTIDQVRGIEFLVESLSPRLSE
jgi:quinol monooxygenase YgiN